MLRCWLSGAGSRTAIDSLKRHVIVDLMLANSCLSSVLSCCVSSRDPPESDPESLSESESSSHGLLSPTTIARAEIVSVCLDIS